VITFVGFYLWTFEQTKKIGFLQESIEY
jgi:hypothetical protein